MDFFMSVLLAYFYHSEITVTIDLCEWISFILLALRDIQLI